MEEDVSVGSGSSVRGRRCVCVWQVFYMYSLVPSMSIYVWILQCRVSSVYHTKCECSCLDTTMLGEFSIPYEM